MNRLTIATIVLLCVCCSSLALTQVQTPASSAPLGSLTGTVLNSATGQPIEGVQVTVVPGQPISEMGIQRLEKPSAENPQTMKVLEAFAIGGKIMDPERKVYSVVTNSGGRFVFNGLSADNYSLSVRADDYIFQAYGEKPYYLRWLPIVVKDGKTDVGVIRMSPGTRVTGTVVNSAGGAIDKVPVYLLDAQMAIDVDGQKNFRVVGDTSTNADGRYVFEKVPAGRYCIAAGSFSKSESMSFSPNDRTGVRVPAVSPNPFTYYPSASDAGLASQIDVPAGGQIALGDLIIPKAKLSTIRGRVVDSVTGKPPASVRVSLNAAFPFLRAGSYGREILSVRYNQTTGVFEATNLIPGTYRVDAELPRPQPSQNMPDLLRLGGVSPQSAFQILELEGEDVQDLVLRVPNYGKVGGRVVVAEGKPLPVADHGLSVPFQLMLRPMGPLQPAPIVTSVSLDDGSFEVGSSLEGKYRFYLAPLKDNYYVSEVRLDGVRIPNGILDISKSQRSDLIITLSPGGEVQGAVIDRKGQPVSQAQGILLPDPLPEIIPFYLEILADASGGFNAQGIPPGNYKIYVWDGVEREQFFDRDRLLQTHALATSVHVDKGSRVTTSVPIID
jgi:5-hydroxyisourate hydrolase-like protein (transthyretin family)